MITPRTPSGTLELLPREQTVFQHMVDIIRRGFERFGFVPVETPVFELKDVLLTKSGGETEKQVYFVQSTGGLQQGHEADLALRFDLTVPLARYVAQHERELAFPFRRYQMQRVYRGERAQKGRFREFYQCDIDVIGKDKLSPAYDAELPAIISRIFEELNIGAFTIYFSNRKILRGLLAGLGVASEETKTLILREIDKLDKVGADKVRAAIMDAGLSSTAASSVLELVAHKGTKDDILSLLRGMAVEDPVFREGVDEIASMIASLRALGVPEDRTRLDLSIARGLDYYTGSVYETKVNAHPEFGSICSGGRYDDLAGHYTKSKLPGVGISIGLTRLFDLLRANDLLPEAPCAVQVLVAQMDPALRAEYLALATALRAAGLRVETWLEPAKLDKQLKYANKAGIPIVLLLGEDEQAKGSVVIKDMVGKEQKETPRDEVVAAVRGMLEA
ncbi:MAG: histidine--tRNA ligase [Alphaproteobacteria bacterium]|nr:histidine--tRNA ligase [Alphaproteobacteria bacterium]